MKSIIRYFTSYNETYFIYVILAYTTLLIRTATSTPPSCGLYGAPPCRFLPAPPGQTPSCARPGKTYCEHIDNYPTYLIKHLVHKWGYEAKNLLVDETWDDFAAVAWHDTPVFYDPTYIFNQHNNNNNNKNKNNNNGKEFNGYNYETPPYEGNTGNNYNNEPYRYAKPTSTEGPSYLLYTSAAGQRLNFNQNDVSAFSSSSTVKSTPNNPTVWLKRFVRDLSKEPETDKQTDIAKTKEDVSAATRDVSLNMDLWDIMGVAKTQNSRTKRQSPGRTSLCQTTSQFITPQAALNNKGNWMFVVNEANTARQTVKAELCASNTCSNLCQLPNGYNSRCEQKFVQKRLIALQANGQNLYTDTFWFPSCCICTISAN